GGTSLSLTGAGAASYNSIANTTEATITASPVTAGAGGVTLSATDDSSIDADAGGVAIALNLAKNGSSGASGAVGIAIAENDVHNAVRARITGSSTVVSAGAVELTADSKVSIDALTIGASVSASVPQGSGFGGSGAGSGSGNTVGNHVEARILDSTVTTTAGAVTLSPSDDSKIHANAGCVAVALAKSRGSGTTGAVAVVIAVAISDIR